jgi:hypothetical protein
LIAANQEQKQIKESTMARPGITYEAVAEAAQALLLKNEKITILKIREELGGVGSTTTISKFYKEWKVNALASSANVIKKTDTTIGTQTAEITTQNQNDNLHLDDNIKALLENSSHLTQEMLNTMSDEWDTILNESDTEIKTRKLHAALIKEQSRRESAEHMSRDAKNYAEAIKEQVTHRVNELKDTLEGQIAFLNTQIRTLKKTSEQDLEYYREQLTKANKKIISLTKDHK